MYLSLSKPENWITIGIILVAWMLAIHVLAQVGVNVAPYLGLGD